MAVAFVKNHTPGGLNTTGSSVAFQLSSVVPAGNLIVAWYALDNVGTNGPVPTSITKAPGETAEWEGLGGALSNTGTNQAGVVGFLFAIKTTVDWPAASYSAFLAASTKCKIVLAAEFSGVDAVLRGVARSNNDNDGTNVVNTMPPDPLVGDLVLGVCGWEAFDALVPAADTVGGPWLNSTESTHAVGAIETAPESLRAAFEYKITTANDVTHTYNPRCSSLSKQGVAVMAALTPASEVVETGGKTGVWDGTTWVDKPMKYWDGTAWVEKPLKRWDGTSWVLT